MEGREANPRKSLLNPRDLAGMASLQCAGIEKSIIYIIIRAANSTNLVVEYNFFNTPATFLQYYFHSQQSTIFCQQVPALFKSCSLLQVLLIA